MNDGHTHLRALIAGAEDAMARGHDSSRERHGLALLRTALAGEPIPPIEMDERFTTFLCATIGHMIRHNLPMNRRD
jgi:hypothetical protein